MFHVARSSGGDTSELVMKSWFFPGIGAFFMVLGALNVVAGLVAAKIGTVLGPGLFCGLFGVVYGFYPISITVKADRRSDELGRTSRSLLSRSTVTERLSEFAAVSIQAGTYYWFFNAVRKDGTTLRLFSQMKRGWTWTAVPSPEVVARGAEIAEALSLPLGPPS